MINSYDMYLCRPLNIMHKLIFMHKFIRSWYLVMVLCFGLSWKMNYLVLPKLWRKFWLFIADLVVFIADSSPDFSPFILCVMEKCLKVIRPKSGTCSWPKKSMVLLYTCNTVKYLLQTQVHNI